WSSNSKGSKFRTESAEQERGHPGPHECEARTKIERAPLALRPRMPALQLAQRFLLRSCESAVALDDELHIITGFIVRRNGVAVLDDRIFAGVVAREREINSAIEHL